MSVGLRLYLCVGKLNTSNQNCEIKIALRLTIVYNNTNSLFWISNKWIHSTEWKYVAKTNKEVIIGFRNANYIKINKRDRGEKP